jgi:hypothetical protein
MFREIAIVTFSAAMIGTGAATLVNAHEAGTPPAPPAIERGPRSLPAEGQKTAPKRDEELLALGPARLH